MTRTVKNGSPKLGAKGAGNYISGDFIRRSGAGSPDRFSSAWPALRRRSEGSDAYPSVATSANLNNRETSQMKPAPGGRSGSGTHSE